MICVHCGEVILPNEVITEADGKLHRECFIRLIVGSVGHQLKMCSCYGGNTEDAKNLSIRENARAAANNFSKVQTKIANAKFN